MKFRLVRIKYYWKCFWKLLFNVKWIFPNKILIKESGIIYKLCSISDLMVIKEVILDGDYESLGINIGIKDKIIVDIGAAFGDWSIMTAKKHPKANIYAFEPVSCIYKAMVENCKTNHITNINPINEAVTSLNQLSKYTGKNVDLLKIDCEGGEYEIFKLNNFKSNVVIKKIVMEYHEYGDNKVSTLINNLEKLGYIVNTKPQRGIIGLGFLSAIHA